MHIVLIDDNGDREVMRVEPQDVLRVQDLFCPCAECGKAVLTKYINADGICDNCMEAEAAVGFGEHQSTP